jgi:hypothetical protein
MLRLSAHIRRAARGETAMEVLTSPFVKLWNWVDHTGGFPGKVIFVIIVIMLILGVVTWVGNKNR